MTDKPIIYIDGVRAEPELQAVAWRPVVEDQRLYLVPDGPAETRYYIDSYSAEGDTAWFRVSSSGNEPA